MRWFRKVRQYFRVVRRVRERLPVCSPDGGRLVWDVYFHTPVVVDVFSGRRRVTGLSTVYVRQRAPVILSDHRVYQFDLKSGVLSAIKGARWSI